MVFSENFLSVENFLEWKWACRGRWEVRYHIADYAKKIKMVAV
jgi:hypothetical protein